MDKFDRAIDNLAKVIYETHRKESPITGRFPPGWDSISNEVKEFVRKQAFNVAQETLATDWTDTEFAHIEIRTLAAE